MYTSTGAGGRNRHTHVSVCMLGLFVLVFMPTPRPSAQNHLLTALCLTLKHTAWLPGKGHTLSAVMWPRGRWKSLTQSQNLSPSDGSEGTKRVCGEDDKRREKNKQAYIKRLEMQSECLGFCFLVVSWTIFWSHSAGKPHVLAQIASDVPNLRVNN